MRTYGVEIRPEQALDLLVTDPLLPDSMRRALDAVSVELEAIGTGPDRASTEAANRMTGRLRSLVLYEWPDAEDKPRLLAQIAELSLQLHGSVNAVYFDY